MISFYSPIEDFVLSEQSELTDDVSASSVETTLPIINTDGFAVNDFIIIGRIGYDKTEIRKITEITDETNLKVEKLNIAKKKGDPVQKIAFNKKRLYRSDSKAGTYTLLTTTDIEADKPRGTYFEDTTGTTSNWYKCTYYNSVTGLETSLDQAEAVKAADLQHYVSIMQIKRQAGLEENEAISDLLIADYRDAAENEIDARISSVYSVPLSTVPKIITHVAMLLAAGYLLMREYGMEADIEIGKSGQRMINAAHDFLDRIVSGAIKLIDSDGNELSRTSIFTASGSNEYDGTTADKGELFNLADEQFRMKDPDNPLS